VKSGSTQKCILSAKFFRGVLSIVHFASGGVQTGNVPVLVISEEENF
jgi:hypothetical protein